MHPYSFWRHFRTDNSISQAAWAVHVQDLYLLGTSALGCCSHKSGVALRVNTLQQELQMIIVECFIAVIKLECSSLQVITC